MDWEMCQFCKRPFQPLADAGKWTCAHHPGRLVEGRWTCCGRRDAVLHENEYSSLSYDGTYRGDLFYAERTLTDAHGLPGCTPCDHRRRNWSAEELRKAVRAGLVDPGTLQARPGFHPVELFWCEAQKNKRLAEAQ